MSASPDIPVKLPPTLSRSIKDFFAPIAIYCTKATAHEAEFVLPTGVEFDGADPAGLFSSIRVDKGVTRKRGMDWSIFTSYEPTGETRWRFTY